MSRIFEGFIFIVETNKLSKKYCVFTQKYLVTLVIFLDLLTHMQKGEPGPSLAEVSPGGGGGVVEEEEDKVSCDWLRAVT